MQMVQMKRHLTRSVKDEKCGSAFCSFGVSSVFELLCMVVAMFISATINSSNYY